MYAPPHPGAVLKDVLMEGLGLSVSLAAEKLGVDRTTLSRLLHGHAALSVEMALRLSKALNTTPDLWLGLQHGYDVWEATQSGELDLSAVECFVDVTQAEWRG
jgi:addiction module HigA family antidote